MLAAFCAAEPAKEGRASFELRRVPKPSTEDLPAGTILIKSYAVSICGSDLWGKGGCCDSPEWRRPTDYLRQQMHTCGGTGHEALGEVAEVVEPCRFRVGQRVLALSAAYVQAVGSIRAAFESETGESANTLPRAGAFSEFFVSHACVCIAVPTHPPPTCPSFDPRWYLAAQPLGTLIHAVKKLGSIMGMNVAIVGQGGNGLIMTSLIERLGARRIIAMDILEDRLELSKKSGASHTILSSTDPSKKDNIKKTIRDITEGDMCDIAVDCVGHNEYSFDLAAAMTKDAGTVLLFGLPPAQDETGFTIRSPDFRRNIRYQTTHSPDMKTFELAVDFLKLGRFDPSLLFTHYIPFTKFPEAYDMASNYNDGVVKIILTFD